MVLFTSNKLFVVLINETTIFSLWSCVNCYSIYTGALYSQSNVSHVCSTHVTK